jgi:hypothetical protein
LLFGKNQSYFDDGNVWTPSEFGDDDFTGSSSKNAMLEQLSIYSNDKIQFYDDDHRNISQAKEIGIVNSVLVKCTRTKCGLATIDDYIPFTK